jgi:hypothetical protein
LYYRRYFAVPEMADVSANGQANGATLWKLPFRVDVTDALRIRKSEMDCWTGEAEG